MANPSPLRYPGGKNRLARFISLAIENLNLTSCTYVEPFAGGAGVALSLLLDSAVDNVIINDYDKAIYSLWRAIKEEPSALMKKVRDTPVSIEEWRKQRRIYEASSSYSLELAFATLFLNRTNRSGILNAGPIGGYAQAGNWKIDARFDKESIISKISAIAERKKQITVYNKDIISLLRHYTNHLDGNAFFYFDPPYYNKGQKLYKNHFSPKDHRRIHDAITNEVTAPWIITYDDVGEIANMYSNHPIKRFDLTYSAANKGTASEIMIFSDIRCCPSDEQIADNRITINLRS